MAHAQSGDSKVTVLNVLVYLKKPKMVFISSSRTVLFKSTVTLGLAGDSELTSFVIGGEKITVVYKFSVKPISQPTYIYLYIYISLFPDRFAIESKAPKVERPRIFFFCFCPSCNISELAAPSRKSEIAFCGK